MSATDAAVPDVRSTPRVVATTATVAAAVIASMYALSTVISAGPWTATGVRLVLVLAVVTGAVRVTQTRRRARTGRALAPPAALAPSVAGLVVGAWALLGLYGGPTDRFSALVGLTNVERLVARLGTARELTLAEVAPIDPSLPIELMAVSGVVLVFLVADLLAGGLSLSSAVALPLLALWVPGLVLEGSVPAAAFVVAVAALLLLLAVDNPYRPVRRAPPGAARWARQRRTATGIRAGSAVAGALVVAVLGSVVGSASATLPQVVSSSWSRMFSSTGETVRLSDDLDMRRNLDERSEEVVLRYRTDGPDAGPLRVFTLTGFDGTNWRRGDDRAGEPVAGPEQLLWPAQVERGEARDVTITLATLRDTRLPVPTEPRALDAVGDWSYDAVRDEVVGGDATDSGLAYEVTVFPRDLTADTLRGATGNDPGDPNYLDVPATAHEQDLRDLAAAVVGNAATRYDQALALQTYFRDTTLFTYSTAVPAGETGDAVWDFLQHRTGYCVQFATSMTLLARTLGIPARLAVGFLPGQRVDGGTFEVTGQDSHAWPELYFPELGWVRFEPTPAQQTGPAPRWATPVADGGDSAAPLPQEVPTATTEPTPAEPGTAAPGVPAPGSGADATGPSPWLAAAVVVGLLVLAGLPTWALLRRRARPHRVRDAEDAWVDLTAALGGLGVTWGPSTTPRQVPAAVATSVRAASGRRLPDETVDALLALTSAVESERYARDAESLSAPRLRELVAQAVAGVRECLSDRPARADGPSGLPVG